MSSPDRSALRSTNTHVLVNGGSLGGGGAIPLDDDTEHHLRRVLRLRDGDVVSVTDGERRWCLAVAVSAGGVIALEATSDIVTEPIRSRVITIASAMPKGDRLDWMVQKATELSVDRLVLLHADRSAVRWKSDRVDHQLVRLQRIADEALRQSRRVVRLRIDAPRAAVDVLCDYVIAEPGPKADGVTLSWRSHAIASIWARRSCAPRPPYWQFPHSAWHSNADRLCSASYPRVTCVTIGRRAPPMISCNRTARRERDDHDR